MEIHSICLRKKLLGGITEKWGSPLTVDQFIKKYAKPQERQEVIDNEKDIVFYDTKQEEIPYQEAIQLYKIAEQKILNG